MPSESAPGVHITYTGGTIGMIDSPHGLVPSAELGERLLAHFKGTDLDGRISLTVLDPLIDSANATPDSWQAIVDDLREHRAAAPTESAADSESGQSAENGGNAGRAERRGSEEGPGTAGGYVVLHGTDTMAYTSAALSYALTDFDRPIVVTGSQLPLGVVGSDAIPNVTGALRAATSGLAPGVSVFFGHHLLAGNRITKASSWAFDGFSSPGAEPLAAAGAPWRWAPSRASGAGWSRPLPYARHDVVVIDLVPGITAARLRALVTPLPEAIILRAFGVGNVPNAEPGLTDVVVDAIDAGAAVVVASQCHEAEVLPGRYEASDAIARAGAVGSRDMTLEATYAKVQFLLAQGLRGAELAEWMSRSIAGELTESHDR